MAIDDNTSYELTGAQVKDLANKIKAKAADNIFVGATSAAPGSKGLVPAPQAADDTKFLSGDGTWKTVPAGQVVTKFYVANDLDTSGTAFEMYKDSQMTTPAEDTDVASAWDAGTVMICSTSISIPAEYILISNLDDMEYGIMGVNSSAKAFCGNLYAMGSNYYTVTNQFQPKLTAGNHITISSNTISANGYVWGDTLTAATTPTGTVTSGMIADGTITATDIATGVVPTITLSTTDIGEGAPLAANTLYGVYDV